MRWKLIILAWMVISVALQLLIRTTAISYDSSGLAGFMWWTTQAIIIPVTALSEALGYVGIQATGFLIYILLTIFVGMTGIIVAHSLQAGTISD
jgi:hypothetical protein